MFRRLASQIQNGAEALINMHPVELIGLLEQAWNLRVHTTPPSPPVGGHPDHRSDVAGFGIPILPSPVLNPPNLTGQVPGPAAQFTDLLNRTIRSTPPGIRWDHLIYAYMIENTRIYEIFARVVHDFLHGERIGTPTNPVTQNWLRNTEELFYRDPPPLSITTITSHIRSDLRASRRNAYQRMFGMDLNHGKDDGQVYPYVRADAANNEFVNTFEDFLREVWLGIVHLPTTSGPNPTDDAKIVDLVKKLHDMLISRRQYGNLSREEFVFVSMMSWFHLTVDSDLPVIRDLRAEASSTEQRLFKIAERVGMPAHGLSKDYFDIAEAISDVLVGIETGVLNDPNAVTALYNPAVTPPPGINAFPGKLKTIITHWSAITGRDMKARKVATA